MDEACFGRSRNTTQRRAVTSPRRKLGRTEAGASPGDAIKHHRGWEPHVPLAVNRTVAGGGACGDAAARGIRFLCRGGKPRRACPRTRMRDVHGTRWQIVGGWGDEHAVVFMLLLGFGLWRLRQRRRWDEQGRGRRGSDLPRKRRKCLGRATEMMGFVGPCLLLRLIKSAGVLWAGPECVEFPFIQFGWVTQPTVAQICGHLTPAFSWRFSLFKMFSWENEWLGVRFSLQNEEKLGAIKPKIGNY